MKRFFQFVLIVLCLGTAWNVQGQRYVLIEPSEDPLVPKDISPIILGDTTATGERVDPNTIYQLQNGQVYVVSNRIESTGGWPIHIEAADLENTDIKPYLSRLPNASGAYPQVIYARGDLTLKNLWIVSGETGPLEEHSWGQIRILGDDARIRVEDCLIEKDRGGFLQLRANNVKCYVDRSIFRNGGNRRILEGNGRGIDARNFQFDTLIVRQTIIHNIIDRVFRSQGGTVPHNYIEFDHCTIFNHVGRHGTFQFGKVKTVKITNNLLINPNMMGTSPRYTDEQTQPDNEAHKVFTVDTLYSDTKFNFASNNIFWTQDVLDFYESIDSVNRVEIYSDLIKQSLGDDAPNTYFQEVVELSNVPVSLLQYVKDLYANPAAIDMFDFVVEDISFQGTPYDSGNLFDFSMFDPCYSPDTQSATAGTDGGPIGAVFTCQALVNDIFEADINNTLNLSVFPNPTNNHATFTYHLNNSSEVRLSIYNFMGQEIEVLSTGRQPGGDHTVNFNLTNQMTRGIYVARLQTEEGQMSLKIMIR